MVKSSAVAFKLPSASRRESSLARYSVCIDSAPSRRCSSSRRRPQATACRSGACAPGSASRRPP
eukprot:2540693-Pleurochrysis_carterae.AAC.1